MTNLKRFNKAQLNKPAWVGDIDLTKCKDGLVYQIYQCRKCIIEFKEDKARENRKKYLLLPGNKKKQMVEVCTCENPTPFLIKYKRCKCGAEFWGFYLRENPTCRICSKFSESSEPEKGTKYYRLGKFYKQTEDDLSSSETWDCLNRNICLESMKHQGSSKMLACLDCPYYEKGSL